MAWLGLCVATDDDLGASPRTAPPTARRSSTAYFPGGVGAPLDNASTPTRDAPTDIDELRVHGSPGAPPCLISSISPECVRPHAPRMPTRRVVPPPAAQARYRSGVTPTSTSTASVTHRSSAHVHP